jgi:hypothetical protein
MADFGIGTTESLPGGPRASRSLADVTAVICWPR